MRHDDFAFLAHNGELARLIRAYDWPSTPLGCVTQWPQSLKTTVALILQSPVPIVTLWGEDGIMIYNDAYSVFAGGRHPQLFGSKVREGWPEVADFNDNVMKVGLAGGTLAYKDQELALQRRGQLEPVWMNLDYSPIIGEDGKPAAVMAIVVETTRRVKAEKALKGERKRLKRMFEQAPGFMAMLTGSDHRFEMANEAYLHLIGGRDIIGQPLLEALPELKGQGFESLLDRVAESGEAYVGKSTAVLLQRAGIVEERYLDFIYQPIVDEERNHIGIFVQGSDVTEQKRAELALRHETSVLGVLNKLGADLAAERDLDKVVQMITDAGVAMTGAKFGAFFYNVLDEDGESYMLYSLSGISRESFAGFPMPRATEVFQPTFKGEGVIRSDDIQRDPRYGKSGPYRGMPTGHLPVRSYLAVPVVSRSGEVIGGLFFGHPEPGIFKQEHEDLVISAAGLAAIGMDNARLFQALERELTERKRAEEALLRVNNNLEQRVADEITERLRMEETLRQSQKMEALGQLTGGVAHDFNNLLQVVSGNLQLLTGDIQGNERAQKRIENALAGVSRGSKLASQLLAFGRRQPLEPKAINIGRFVGGIEDMLRRTLGEAIEIETIQSGGLWNALVDPTQIENALLNLAINSRDAMEGAGKLTIEVANAYLDAAYARQNDDVQPGQYVMLAVTDTGSGMTPEVLAQVFEPFFSTKPMDKGTGLGLSMVYGFVKQSGGHVKIYSAVGQGTTIKLYFPRILQTEDVIVEGDFGPATGGTETILVAEDDDQVRNTVVELLGDLGYSILKAKDAAGALTIIESGASIDLLFTDVVMPGPLRSTELVRKVRERSPEIAVLFTSGYTENSIVHGGRLDEGVELLTKPYTREALARKIRHVLNNHRQRLQALDRSKGMEPVATTHTETAPAEPAPGQTSLRVLLVEDDFLIRMSTADMLADLGHVVDEATTAEQALAILQTQPITVLITDLGLPGMSGTDLARLVRERYPHIGIIFATGHNEAPPMSDPSNTALLTKPFNTPDIVRAIGSLDL
ncbi:hybrid sensor histidine kinase/response regulator [Pararhizobium arenae]|uniref:hybrid sensor histidine kinase/response regulator n=1 Tax=Pararhizobium arenae TaxID=1856850 RepID=UPI000B0A29BC|nr:response regulator [Pararhizobium arenae]